MTSNALKPIDDTPTAIDNFDYDDPSASPIRGAHGKFDNAEYYTGKEKTRIEDGRRFVVLDKASGFVFLKKGCQPEYLMHIAGKPKPERPACGDESDWPIGLDGKASCPWKWNNFVYLIDAETGESLTFSTHTVGGDIVIRDLTAQIKSMRNLRPGAMPVVELASTMMPTAFGKKPRPHFKITGWRDRTVVEEPPPQLEAPEYDEAPEFDDSIAEF